MSRQDKVWCLNVASGDVLNARKWKQYYDVEGEEDETNYNNYWREGQSSSMTDEKTKESDRSFKVGSIVGVLVDQDGGKISFYKDGEDLGVAIVSNDIKNSELYPFV